MPDADIVPKELIGCVRARLAHVRCPAGVAVVDALPRDATGKVLKTEMRSRIGDTSSAVSR